MDQHQENEKVSNHKKITFPSVSKLGLLVFVLLFTLTGTFLWQFFQSKKISEGLKGVYVTDINDRSAVVSWVTSQPNKTELVYSTKEIKSILNIFNSKVGYDRRDLEEVGEFEYKLNRRGNYYVHSVHLRELSPQTEYHFAIRNGVFLNSSQYVNTFSTIPQREKVDSPEVGYGNIYNQDGYLISDTLVFFELTNRDDTNKSQRVSYVMDGKTGWSVNISNLMNSELTEKYVKEKETYLDIYIVNAKGEINKIVSVDKIKPAENVSAYDNQYEEKDTDVKGVMAVLCECKSCTPSCPSGYSTSKPVGYNYITTKPTCISRDACSGEFCETITGTGTCYQKTDPIVTCKQECESCTPYCPNGYDFTCPTGWNCATMNSVCERYEKCTGDRCGTMSGPTCYKPTNEKAKCICNPCEPKCPANFHFGPCKEGYNCTTIQSSCSQVDTCGVRCGSLTTKGATCYKEGNPKTAVSNCEGSNLKDKTGKLIKCEYGCQDNGITNDDFCKAKPQEIDCSSYTDMSSCRRGASGCEWSFSTQKCFSNIIVRSCEGDNLREKDGTVLKCIYGCQDNGVNVNDICKPKPNDTPQEIDCTKYTDMSSCRWADSSCNWSFSDQKCSSSNTVSINCSSIVTQSNCNSKTNCEYVKGKCQEINLDNYIQYNVGADYCSGIRDSKGNIIPISYGFDSLRTHRGTSKCSIDISANEVNLGNQIAGSVYNPETYKNTWKDGYSCDVVEEDKESYGFSIIVTQPDGIKIRYAHLKYPYCSYLVSGNSGGWEPHLHVEVVCDTQEECASCTGKTNPCRAIAGGCFNCEDSVKAQAIFGDDGINTSIKINSSSLFSLISKVRAQEIEPIDPAILIKDLELQEGKYNIKSGTATKLTDFVKTDNNQIVFYEDTNSNGKLDSDETLLSPYEAQLKYQVNFEKTADTFTLNLQEGLNLVSFPVIFKNDKEEEIKKASELIEYLNLQGTEITTITAYRGGKFLPYVIRNGKGFGDDFNILPGEGYFVLSHSSGEFIYSGTKIKDGLEVQLYEGWNLVNIYNSNVKSYSGFQVLKDMKEQSVGADIVTKWEDGMYINIVSEESGQYGDDFDIYQNRGYFVRVAQNGGPFKPK